MAAGFGLANFLFTIPAYKFIDWRGRRVLLLISLGGMFFTLCATSGFFRIENESTRRGLVAAFAIVVFTFFYGIGAGPVPFTFSAEVFPLAFRGKQQSPLGIECLLIFMGSEVGMSFSVMVNFLGLSILILFVPKLTSVLGADDHLGHSNLLFAFTWVHPYMFQTTAETLTYFLDFTESSMQWRLSLYFFWLVRLQQKRPELNLHFFWLSANFLNPRSQAERHRLAWKK